MHDFRTAVLAPISTIRACLLGHASARVAPSRESVEDTGTTCHRGADVPGKQTIVGDAPNFFGKAKGNFASGDAGMTWDPADRSGDAAPGRTGAAFATFREPAPSRATNASIARADLP